jgi:hypothetical protein
MFLQLVHFIVAVSVHRGQMWVVVCVDVMMVVGVGESV